MGRSCALNLARKIMMIRLFVINTVWVIWLISLFVAQPFVGVYGLIVTIALTALALPFTVRAGAHYLRGEISVWMILAAAAIVLLFNIVHAKSPAHYLTLFSYLGLISAPFAYLIARHFTDAVWMERIATLAAFGAACAMAIALWDVYVAGFERASSIINPLKLGQTSLLLAIFSFSGLLFTTRAPKVVYIWGVVFAVATIVLTSTRGTLIASVPVIIFMIGFGLYLLRPKQRLIALISALLFVILAAFLVINFVPTFNARTVQLLAMVQEFWRSGLTLDPSTDARLLMYQGAWHAFLAHPLLGVGGFEALEYGKAMLDPDVYPGTAFSPGSIEHMPHLHSDLFTYLAGGGLLGLTALILLLAAPFASFFAKDNRTFVRLFLALSLSSATFFAGLSNAILTYDLTVTSYTLMVIMLATIYRAPANDFSDPAATASSD